MRWFDYPPDHPNYKRGKRQFDKGAQKFAAFQGRFQKIMEMSDGKEKAEAFKRLTEKGVCHD